MKIMAHLGIALAVVAVFAVAWLAGHHVAAEGQEPPAGVTRWEYAHLYVGDGNPVLYRAKTATTFVPPSPTLSTGLSARRENVSAYVLQSKPGRNHDLFALDLVGSRGWEAVSTVRQGDGLLILLKRPKLGS
jgi:hypothetical protein